ncbi:MAG TPA: DegT/DnrJ/EryC1/StrS family aminotransferase [Alphaproteobacteria bacterium]|nr:DegT/DnrJ/EryC1/StrS family aminotransferase [Alphaproteobacteria bacterium]
MIKVPMFRPLIEQPEIDAAVEALRMGWLGMGSYVNEMEQALTAHLDLGDKRLALVNTGHSALHLALEVANVGPGDEVITPSFNCVSDFQAILQTGAEPVLCDVRDDTLTIDVASAEPLVSERTKAVIFIDYAASLADYDAVEAFAAKHGLRVIHDAAHSFNSRDSRGRMVGSFSDLTMLSFDPVKTLTCLDAGAIIVNNDEELARVHEMRILGMGQPPSVMYQNKRAWTFHVNDHGYRYHVLNLHAAIGLQQLAKIERIAETRRDTCAYYLDRLAGIDDLVLPQIDLENATPFIFVVRVPGERRDDFRTKLGENGIDTGVHWQPGHHFEVLTECRRGNLRVSMQAGDEIVSLPLHSAMEEAAMEAVADTVTAYFKGTLSRDGGGDTALEQIAAAG